ncbi:NADH-quinone oxidoreductase subunit N [Thermodesulfovibrio hydrogeniphilus]
MSNYNVILPEIVFTALFLIYFVAGLFIKNRTLNSFLVIATAAITAFTLFNFYGEIFNGMFVADQFSQTLKLVSLLSLVLCTVISIRYKEIKDEIFYEYSILMMLSTLAMMLVVSSRDFITLFLSVEFMSLGLYLLAGSAFKDLKSNEASIKYYVLGSFISAFFLFGIAVIYGVTGNTNFISVAKFIEINSSSQYYLIFGVLAIVSALCFKAGCAPFHQWSPDVYEGAPTPVTAFMSVGPKAAAVGAIARVIFEAFKGRLDLWLPFLVFIALLTIAIGNVLALRQKNLKRLLAYSSIAHAGYVMLAVIACSQESLSAISFYMIVYAFMNIGTFATVMAVPDGEKIESYAGLSMSNLYISVCMLFFLFSLAGIPPFGGFVAKFLVFKSIINAGYIWVAVVGIIFSILSAFYYLRIVMKMFFESRYEAIKLPVHSSFNFTVGVNATVILIAGLIPNIFMLTI